MTPQDTPAFARSGDLSSTWTRPVADMSPEGLALRLAARKSIDSRVASVANQSGLVLLLLALGVLLFRPADIFPVLTDEPIYAFLVAGCVVVSLPRLWALLTGGTMRRNGIMALLFLLVPAVVLSHLSHANTYDARLGGLEMVKACILFALVVVLVDSPRKFTATLLVMMVALLVVAVLAVLNYHNVLDLPALEGVADLSGNPDNPEPLMRLRGVGVFNDPNDFALVLVTAAIICAFGLRERRAGRVRWVFLFPLALFGYALFLTHSRGGLLSAVGALLAFLLARFGWRNVLPLACLLVPILLVPFWGRQTSIGLNDPEDTFQTRLELWSQSLDIFRASPLLGIGQGKLVDSLGQVTHNSYLHAFAELGLVGGTLFIGAFYLTLRSLWRATPADENLARLRPYVLALTVGYATGLLSLSRCYTVPTQLILALAMSYLVLASRTGPSIIPRLNWACARRISGVGVAFLGATYMFVRLMVHHG